MLYDLVVILHFPSWKIQQFFLNGNAVVNVRTFSQCQTPFMKTFGQLQTVHLTLVGQKWWFSAEPEGKAKPAQTRSHDKAWLVTRKRLSMGPFERIQEFQLKGSGHFGRDPIREPLPRSKFHLLLAEERDVLRIAGIRQSEGQTCLIYDYEASKRRRIITKREKNMEKIPTLKRTGQKFVELPRSDTWRYFGIQFLSDLTKVLPLAISWNTGTNGSNSRGCLCQKKMFWSREKCAI